MSLDVYPHLLQNPFIIILQTQYLATGSNLSWDEPSIVKLIASSKEQGTIKNKNIF